jgi:hypothetical protein
MYADDISILNVGQDMNELTTSNNIGDKAIFWDK